MISVYLLLDFMRFSRGFSPRFFASFEKLAVFAWSLSRSFESLADFADLARSFSPRFEKLADFADFADFRMFFEENEGAERCFYCFFKGNSRKCHFFE